MNLLHVILVVSCVYGSVRAGNDLNDLDPHHHDEETHTSSTTEKHVNHREEEPHLPSYQFLRSGRGNPNPNNQKPIKPQSPDCGMYFPGTPAWNDCFRKFMQSMANFQGQVHEFNKNKVQVGSSTQQGNTFYSTSSDSFSNSQSTSVVGGYTIQAVNLPISTSIANGMLKITLPTYSDKVETKRIRPNEIVFNIVSKNGDRKWARLFVPKPVNMNEVMVDRAPDAVYISAPVLSNHGPGGSPGNYEYSQSSSSGTFSNQNYGGGGSIIAPPQQSYSAPAPIMIPPPPMPDLSNMFQNLFHNVFSMFGPSPAMRNQQQQQQQQVRYYRDAGEPGYPVAPSGPFWPGFPFGWNWGYFGA